MGSLVDKEVLARKRAHKRYLKEFADVRAGKKLSPSCAILTEEIIKLMTLEKENGKRLKT